VFTGIVDVPTVITERQIHLKANVYEVSKNRHPSRGYREGIARVSWRSREGANYITFDRLEFVRSWPQIC